MTEWDKLRNKFRQDTPAEIDIIETFAQLYSERIKRGVSQAKLAKKMGMTQAELAKLELLEETPTLETLYRYAKGLGLDIALSVYC